MRKRALRCLSVLLFAVALPAFAQSGERQQVVDGLRLYFGMVPSVLLRGRNEPHVGSGRDAHGRPRADVSREHHLLLAIFDAADGKRVESAAVTASVPVAGSTVTRPLEPMQINDTVTFGNVFVLPGAGPYTFEVTIVAAGRPRPVRARFVYAGSHGPPE